MKTIKNNKKIKLNKLFKKYCKNKNGLSEKEIIKLIKNEYNEQYSKYVINSLMNIWGKKVNNKVALTGEIDLCKNVTAIGGVYAKLNGAKKAGVTKALIPQENMEDLERLRRENISPEDENFIVKPIATIEDVLRECLIDDDLIKFD